MDRIQPVLRKLIHVRTEQVGAGSPADPMRGLASIRAPVPVQGCVVERVRADWLALDDLPSAHWRRASTSERQSGAEDHFQGFNVPEFASLGQSRIPDGIYVDELTRRVEGWRSFHWRFQQVAVIAHATRASRAPGGWLSVWSERRPGCPKVCLPRHGSRG